MTGKSRNMIDNQKGMALITVLLVTALVAMLAVSMSFAQHVAVRRTANLLEGDQAMVLALGLEEWARQVLTRDGGNTDHLGENWAMGLPPTAVDNGMVSGSFTDMQGRINLNNLASTDQSEVDQAKDMLGELFDYCKSDNSPVLVEAVKDWVDDNDNDQGVAEDNDYLLHEPPYLAANRRMKSPSELLLINGITPDIYSCVKDYVTALPETTKINLNTAKPVVISTLSSDLSVAEAEEIVGDRPEKGYENNLSDFLSHPLILALTANQIKTSALTTGSNYFMAHERAIFGDAEVELYSLFSRVSVPEVVARSIGTY